MSTTTTPAGTTAADAASAAAGTPVLPSAPSTKGKTPWSRIALQAVPPLIVLGVLIGGWYVVHALLGTRDFLMPTPDQVISEGFLDSRTRSQILSAVLHTTYVTITGLAIAAAIGIIWAVAMSMASWVQRSTYPYAVILQCIPILAIVPLIGVWFGYEFKARVVVCVMISLFPMVANTLFGLKSVERSQIELFALQKARPGTVLAKLTFPAALPSIFVGLRTSAGLAVVGAIVGDFFFQRGTPGVGSLLQTYARVLDYPSLFAAIFVAALLGVAMFGLFGLIAKLAVGRWYEAVN